MGAFYSSFRIGVLAVFLLILFPAHGLPAAEPATAIDVTLAADGKTLPEERAATEDGLTDAEIALLRSQLEWILGTADLPAPGSDLRPDLNAEIVGQIDEDGYVVYLLRYESFPGFYVSANLYVPDSPAGFPFPRPAVVCPHGHWSDAKADPNVQVRSIGLALQGFVVLAYDTLGYGDRFRADQEYAEGHDACSSAQAMVAGPLVRGIQAYEVSRAIDYLDSRPDLAIADAVGVTGASGGASQAIVAAALAVDERIAAVVPVGYHNVGTNPSFACGCGYAPYLGSLVPPGDLFALVYPTPVHFLDELEVDVSTACQTYSEHGLGDAFEVTWLDGEPHGFGEPLRERMYAWMTRWLVDPSTGDVLPDPEGVADDMELPTPAELSVPLPEDRLSLLELSASLRDGLPGYATPAGTDEWTALHEQIAAELDALADAPESPDPLETEVRETGDGFERIGVLPEEMSVEVVWSGGSQTYDSWTEIELYTPGGDGPWPCVLLVNPPEYPDATDEYAGLYSPLDDANAIAALLAEDYAVARLAPRFSDLSYDSKAPTDPTEFQIESAIAIKMNWAGAPLFWRRLHDLRAAIGYLETRADIFPARISVWGIADGALLGVAASAIDTRTCQTVADRGRLSFAAAESDRHPLWSYPPHVLESADIAQLAGMAAPRPLIVAGPIDDMRTPLSSEAIDDRLEWTESAYAALGSPSDLHATTATEPAAVAGLLDDACGPCAGCAIDRACVDADAVNPENECEVCDPARSDSAWSPRDGESCDDGLFCTLTDTCVANVCTGGGSPCGDEEVCDEEQDACEPDIPGLVCGQAPGGSGAGLGLLIVCGLFGPALFARRYSMR